MKKLLIIAVVVLGSSLSFYSCKASGGGDCPTYGGSGYAPVKHVGKSL
jgi:hypothetical protein